MNKEFSDTSKNNIFTYLFGVIIGTAVAIISMLVFSALMLFSNLNREYATVFATISVAIGTFIASFFTARRIGKKGYLVGLIIGGVVFAMIMLISLAISQDAPGSNTLFHLVIFMFSSLVGGVSGVNKKSKKII